MENKFNKILFLDFDGVLNSNKFLKERSADKGGFRSMNERAWKLSFLSGEAMLKLNRIVRETDCFVVISSSWRIISAIDELKSILKEKGFNYSDRIISTTPRLNNERGHEIQEWLDNNPANRFVILDDDSDMVHLLPFLVKTKAQVGLTDSDVEKVVALLNSKK